MNKKENRMAVRQTVEKAVIRDEQNRRIQSAATNPVKEVLKILHTTLRGLEADTVSVNRSKYGTNKVTHEKKKSLAKRVAGAFINPFTAILFCLAFVSTITDMIFPYFSLFGSVPEDFDFLTVVIILTMVFISGTLRFVQESRSGNAAEKLLAMITTTCTVTRIGQEKTEIPMDDLVVGDIVHLSAGDMIPADVRILDAKDLFVSQASLTGESEPIEKLPHVSPHKDSVTDYTNIAFMGSNVISGSATAVVICVGDHTLFGSMAAAVAGEAVETSFTKGVNALEEQQVAVLESEQVFRNPVKEKEQRAKTLVFTAEQEHAIECFWQEYSRDVRAAYLLYGVTGSGKTEVYIEMIRRVVSEGKQAIVLIPEIALTYQTVMRFYRRFGNRVSILNSRMSAGERYDQLMRAKAGEIDVMIGPRSALFTPFPELGLIVIDEEHETTYKSEQIPRYHARETAIERANLEHASVVLGSATPSLEAMYRAKNGEYRLLELKNRSGMQKMASVYVADLRQELKEGNRSILSRHLQELMEDRLEKQEQIMLFLNRRGYAGFLSCRECGHVVKCPHCDVSLSYHRNGKMVCHYCGYEEPRTPVCPECGSRHIGEFRAGTQQIEDIVKAQFPQARVLRMDMDTTRQKDGHEKILSAFANGEADVLVGTQMIVKGHDFPNVTLVGVLAADMSLYSDDYRSGERTFQLLTQAAGRAGRGQKEGEAVIQTYTPTHYSIVTAAAQDYEAFYEEEIRYRQIMGYPPVENLLAVLVSCEDEVLLETGCKYLKEFSIRIAPKETAKIIGPASPGIGKINDVYRKVIYIKDENYDTLVRIKNGLEQYIEVNPGYRKMRIQFDFNPMHVF